MQRTNAQGPKDLEENLRRMDEELSRQDDDEPMTIAEQLFYYDPRVTKVFVTGKLTPKLLTRIFLPRDATNLIKFSYPPYNQKGGLMGEIKVVTNDKEMEIDEPLFKASQHANIAKLIKHPMFVDMCQKLGIKVADGRIDRTILQKVIEEGTNEKLGKVTALRKFMSDMAKLHPDNKLFSTLATNLDTYQQHLRNIPDEVQTDLETLNNWIATIPGVNANFRDLVHYDDVLSAFGPERVTLKQLQDLGFQKGEFEEIKSSLSWLSKSFVLFRINGSLVDLVNTVRALYSTTKFKSHTIEQLIAKLIKKNFVLPSDAWIPDVIIGDGEVDDDLAMALRLLVSKLPLVYILQKPVGLPQEKYQFYQGCADLKELNLTLYSFEDENSKNLDKIMPKLY